MQTYTVYNDILQGNEATLKNARKMAQQINFAELETHIQNIQYGQHKETIDGIGIYYDYGADYYFFTKED